jgi:hypothetical protein
MLVTRAPKDTELKEPLLQLQHLSPAVVGIAQKALEAVRVTKSFSDITVTGLE